MDTLPAESRKQSRRLPAWLLGLTAAGLIAPSLLPSWRAMSSELRLAIALRQTAPERRQEIVLGHYPAALSSLVALVPASATIALVPATERDRDVAMFAVYHLFPHPARVYAGIDAWRANQDGGAGRARRPAWLIVVDEASASRLVLFQSGIDGAIHQVAVR